MVLLDFRSSVEERIKEIAETSDSRLSTRDPPE
jgi:hypothetical protein